MDRLLEICLAYDPCMCIPVGILRLILGILGIIFIYLCNVDEDEIIHLENSTKYMLLLSIIVVKYIHFIKIFLV